MPAPQTEWTAEMVRSLPDDGKRYEVLDGVLAVSPAPNLRHQEILKRLFRLIDAYVLQYSLGWTYWSPADIEFSPQRYVQPDLFVVPDTGHGMPQRWPDVRTLLLVIEGLSPSTARTDRVDKRHIYQSEGVPEYWIVDPDSRVVERWRPDDRRPEVLTHVLEWSPRTGIPPLQIDLMLVFSQEGA